MLARLMRLQRNSLAIYRETGSTRAACVYAGRMLATKASLLGRHARALRRTLSPWHAAAEVKRLEALRQDGGLVLAIGISGGIGDVIVAARFVRDLAAQAGAFTFDVFAARPSLIDWIFSAVPGFARAHPDSLLPLAGRAYDLELQIHQGLVIRKETANWARIRQVTRMHAAITHAHHALVDGQFALYLNNHPRLDNGLARKAVMAGRTRSDFLHGMAGIVYGGHIINIPADESALARLGLQGKAFITVHNGFDTNFIISGKRATKCYPYFDRVVTAIKAARPDVLIVQIGTTTSEAIPDVDLNLIGQTSLQEVSGLLRATMLHLDNEGGLVHLAACYGRRSLVVFGPTPSDYFGYAGNININPLKCGNCWWLDDLWMDRCPRGLDQPECMFSQPPEHVATLAIDALAGSITSTPLAARIETAVHHG
jgi:ADP-heptose:LPS heptosyltransferase